MEVDRSGRILVLDYSDNVVAAFNANGTFSKNILTAADGLSQGQDLLYAPAPATLALLGLGGLMMLRHRR